MPLKSKTMQAAPAVIMKKFLIYFINRKNLEESLFIRFWRQILKYEKGGIVSLAKSKILQIKFFM
ncbi:MAG: hypothetical protein LBC07_03295, partial [Elusimicrobiota bacterium]|nr:hypothetical protein [Elusimicrobiota bacterium]